MPIPPPPPGPPPPPAPPSGGFQQNIGGAPDPQGRNLLLQSIRQGAKLKKAQTNDRSTPIVGGSGNRNGGSRPPVGGNSGGGNSGNSPGFGGGGRSAGPGPLGLGDLFAGGIPKLRPVGGSVAKNKGFSISSTSLHRHEATSPASNHNHSHSQSRETVSISSYSSSTSSINRAGAGSNSPASIHMSLSHKPPPPPPPPSNLKPNLGSGHNNEQNVERKPVNYGKPSLAPKPPAINGGIKSSKPNPPPKLPSLYIPSPPPLPADTVDSGDSATNQMPSTPPSAGGTSVNRAQSMRMPRTASPATPNAASIEYRTMGRSAGREFAAMNASQPPPPPRIIANGVTRVRMSPLRPPSARPPPPPSNKAPPGVPPPPPPSSAPPPPRHRISPAPTPPQVRVNGNLGPLPPVPPGGPPPPPTRNSSMRSVNSGTSITSSSGSGSPSAYTGVDLESRFGHLFPPLEDLPPPGQFMGIMKTYPSKNAHSIKRQPAPQPPTQMQLGSKMWANNTSMC